RLHLLIVEDVPGPAVLGLQAQYVPASHAGNRAVEDRCTPGPLANFARQFRSQARIGVLEHEVQHLVDSCVGDEADKGRLLQFYGQAMAKRSLKNGIACWVSEIRGGSGVFLCK